MTTSSPLTASVPQLVPIWLLAPPRLRVAPGPIVTKLVLARTPPVGSVTVPPLTVVAPVKVLLADNVSCPLLATVSPPGPLIPPARVSVVPGLTTCTVSLAVPPSVSVRLVVGAESTPVYWNRAPSLRVRLAGPRRCWRRCWPPRKRPACRRCAHAAQKAVGRIGQREAAWADCGQAAPPAIVPLSVSIVPALATAIPPPGKFSVTARSVVGAASLPVYSTRRRRR